MKLNKETAIAIRASLESKDLLGIAQIYKEKGLSFTRFIWDAYHSIGHSVTRDIIASHNKDVVVIGGYLTNVNDSHIETMLKRAFSDCKF